MSSQVVGFTGPRSGMTEDQKAVVAARLAELDPLYVVHGDCVGADAEFHEIARAADIGVKLRPALQNPRKNQRAYCVQGVVYTAPPMKPLVRNRLIVDECDVLIATPNEDGKETKRSGTWATIHYARKVGKKILRIAPRGITYEENTTCDLVDEKEVRE